MLIKEFYSNMHGIDNSIPPFFTHIRGTRILVTLQLVADVFRVPRIKFPNYPSYERLWTMSKDELVRISVLKSYCMMLCMTLCMT